MPVQLSPNLRAALAAHVAHGIDAIDARALVNACQCEPDVNAALEAIRSEYGVLFTASGRQHFERVVAGLERGEGQCSRMGTLQCDVALWRAELEREHERKRHAFMLGSVFGFPAVSAAAVVMALEDEERLASFEQTPDSVETLTLAVMRAEALLSASRESTHRLMQLLAAREPEVEAANWLSVVAITASEGVRSDLRARGELLVLELSRKAYPQREAQADALFAKVMLRLSALVHGN